MSSTNSLRDLHVVHRRIREIRENLAQGQRQLEARRLSNAKRSEELDKARAEQKRLASQTATKELERKAKDARVAELQKKLLEASSNKEFTALTAEKAAAVAAKDALEDEILESMVRDDELKAKIKAIDDELVKARQALQEIETQTTALESTVQTELANAERQLRDAESLLPADVQQVYRRLVGRFGADSLAPVNDGSCLGCFTMITPQMQNQLSMHELLFCKSCGRILYTEDVPAAV